MAEQNILHLFCTWRSESVPLLRALVSLALTAGFSSSSPSAAGSVLFSLLYGTFEPY